MLAAYIIYIGGGIMVANICCEMCETIKVEHRHDHNHDNGECSHKHHSHECNQNSCTVNVYHIDIDDLYPPTNIIEYISNIFSNIESNPLITFNDNTVVENIDYYSTAPPPLILTPRGYLNMITSLLI